MSRVKNLWFVGDYEKNRYLSFSSSRPVPYKVNNSLQVVWNIISIKDQAKEWSSISFYWLLQSDITWGLWSDKSEILYD